MASNDFKTCFPTSLLVLLIVAFSSPNMSSARNPLSGIEFIRASCGVTTYPKLCYNSLSRHASLIQERPELLARTALSVTLAEAKTTAAAIEQLSRTQSMKPREAGATRDCIEEMGDSIDELQQSLGEISKLKTSNYRLAMSNIQTWVSAALTDEDTCSDGFAYKALNGNVKERVRARITNIGQMTSNALALINNYATLHE